MTVPGSEPSPQPEVPNRRDVHFKSGKDHCHAWLYLPSLSSSKPPPVIVMAHGLGGIKKLRLDAFAERFCAAGYACLVFDYRYFGESEGEPRELLSIKRQLEDWQAAIVYASTLSEVDGTRIAIWGTSFGGGHVIATAAVTSSVVAAIAQCPFTDGFASARCIPFRVTIGLSIASIRDQIARVLGHRPIRVNVAAPSGEVGLMSGSNAFNGIRSLIIASGLDPDDYHSEVPARVALTIPFYSPGRRARKVRCPILFSVCEHDSVAPSKTTIKFAAQAQLGEIKSYDTGHFDIYVGEYFDKVVGDQIEFLTRIVPPA